MYLKLTSTCFILNSTIGYTPTLVYGGYTP